MKPCIWALSVCFQQPDIVIWCNLSDLNTSEPYHYNPGLKILFFSSTISIDVELHWVHHSHMGSETKQIFNAIKSLCNQVKWSSDKTRSNGDKLLTGRTFLFPSTSTRAVYGLVMCQVPFKIKTKKSGIQMIFIFRWSLYVAKAINIWLWSIWSTCNWLPGANITNFMDVNT
jgi:hypothetical protein